MISIWAVNGTIYSYYRYGAINGPRYFKPSNRSLRSFIKLLGMPCEVTVNEIDNGDVETRYQWGIGSDL